MIKKIIVLLMTMVFLFTGCATVNPHTNVKSKTETELETSRMIGATAGAVTGFTASFLAYKNNNEGWYSDPEFKYPLTWATIGTATILTYFVGWVTGDMVYALTHPEGYTD